MCKIMSCSSFISVFGNRLCTNSNCGSFPICFAHHNTAAIQATMFMPVAIQIMKHLVHHLFPLHFKLWLMLLLPTSKESALELALILPN